MTKSVKFENSRTNHFDVGDLVTHNEGEEVKMYIGMSDSTSNNFGALFEYVVVHGANLGQYGNSAILAMHKKFYGVIELTSE